MVIDLTAHDLRKIRRAIVNSNHYHHGARVQDAYKAYYAISANIHRGYQVYPLSTGQVRHWLRLIEQ